MKLLLSLVIGYLLGAISPSYLISKKKKVDLQKEGTKNLGTTNTIMILGKTYGAFVMFFDIFKAYMAVRICQILFPRLVIAGIAAGGAAVIGHNYPFYIKFKGGKGIAAFAGFILALNLKHFIILLTVCLAIAIISNYSCMLSFSAAITCPRSSDGRRSRTRPPIVEAQKRHPMRQPTWLDIQSVLPCL